MRIDWIDRIFLRMEVWKLRNEVIGRDSMIKRCSRPSISLERMMLCLEVFRIIE